MSTQTTDHVIEGVNRHSNESGNGFLRVWALTLAAGVPAAALGFYAWSPAGGVILALWNAFLSVNLAYWAGLLVVAVLHGVYQSIPSGARRGVGRGLAWLWSELNRPRAFPRLTGTRAVRLESDPA